MIRSIIEKKMFEEAKLSPQTFLDEMRMITPEIIEILLLELMEQPIMMTVYYLNRCEQYHEHIDIRSSIYERLCNVDEIKGFPFSILEENDENVVFTISKSWIQENIFDMSNIYSLECALELALKNYIKETLNVINNVL